MNDKQHKNPPHWPPHKCPWDRENKRYIAPCSLALDCGGCCGLKPNHNGNCVCAGLLDNLIYREVPEEKCFIVFMCGQPDTYRCFNCQTPEEAVRNYRDKYAPEGTHSVRVTEKSIDSSGQTFVIIKEATLKVTY
jgi:hypothetical protein